MLVKGGPEWFWGDTKVYCHAVPFLDNKMAQLTEILPRGRQWCIYSSSQHLGFGDMVTQGLPEHQLLLFFRGIPPWTPERSIHVYEYLHRSGVLILTTDIFPLLVFTLFRTQHWNVLWKPLTHLSHKSWNYILRKFENIKIKMLQVHQQDPWPLSWWFISDKIYIKIFAIPIISEENWGVQRRCLS